MEVAGFGPEPFPKSVTIAPDSPEEDPEEEDRLALLLISSPGETITAYCTGCLTHGDPADKICEDFEGSGIPGTPDAGNTVTVATCNNSSQPWANDIVGSNNYIHAVSHAAGLDCSVKGDYAVEFHNEDNTSGNELCYFMDDSYTNTNNNYFSFYFVVTSHAWDSGGGETMTFLTYDGNNGASHLLNVGVCEDGSGGLKWCLWCKDSGGTIRGPGTLGLGSSITVGTWYRASGYWLRNTSNGCRTFINGVEDIDSSGYTTFDEATDQTYIGSEDDESEIGKDTDGITWQMDLIEFDDDTLPGDPCP